MTYYSHLDNNLWNRVESRLDNYAKFNWDNEDMTIYHVFIINENKGSLKFYNGPSFSNNYTKPQFESASTRLTGVTFNTQQITFTIAVYAVTEDEYRRLIYKLHPYTIGNLIFAFQPEWRYIVKLAKREDSTRYIIGKNDAGQDLYYTELKLTFEVQGDAVAHSVTEIDYIWEKITDQENTNNKSIIFEFYKQNEDSSSGRISTSDLDTPFLLTFKLRPTFKNSPTVRVYSQLEITQQSDSVYSVDMPPHIIDLFQMDLMNLSPEQYTFEYNSQTGDLCLITGDQRQVLSLLTTYNSGKRIVKSLTTKKQLLPGKFSNSSLNPIENWSNIKLKIKYDNCDITVGDNKTRKKSKSETSESSESSELMLDDAGCGINCYARTNLI